MSFDEIKIKKKDFVIDKLPTGEDIKINLDDGHVEIQYEPNKYYHTWMDLEAKEFTDHKGRRWKFKEVKK